MCILAQRPIQLNIENEGVLKRDGGGGPERGQGDSILPIGARLNGDGSLKKADGGGGPERGQGDAPLGALFNGTGSLVTADGGGGPERGQGDSLAPLLNVSAVFKTADGGGGEERGQGDSMAPLGAVLTGDGGDERGRQVVSLNQPINFQLPNTRQGESKPSGSTGSSVKHQEVPLVALSTRD